MSNAAKQPDYRRFLFRKSKRLRPLRRWLQLAAVRGVLALTPHISVPAAQRLGRITGWLFYLFSQNYRRICNYQLQLAMPELTARERGKIVRDCFLHFGMTAWEALARQRIAAEAERWIRLENEAALRGALHRERGVIMLTGHMGNWELLSIVFDMLRLNGRAVVRDLANSAISELLNAHRKTELFDTILRGSADAPRKMLRCLKTNGVLILAIDQDIDAQGLFVDFFGTPANTPRAPASLALKRDVPVITAFGVRNADGSHTFRFEEIPLPTELKAHADSETELTRIFNQVTEAHIRRYPSQWAWHHRRWIRRPDQSLPVSAQNSESERPAE